MTWTYSLKPFLYGLPGTNARVFTQEELQKIFLLYDNVYGPTSISGPTSSSYAKVGFGSSGLKVVSVSVDS